MEAGGRLRRVARRRAVTALRRSVALGAARRRSARLGPAAAPTCDSLLRTTKPKRLHRLPSTMPPIYRAPWKYPCFSSLYGLSLQRHSLTYAYSFSLLLLRVWRDMIRQQIPLLNVKTTCIAFVGYVRTAPLKDDSFKQWSYWHSMEMIRLI